jgi:hypothetical protein
LTEAVVHSLKGEPCVVRYGDSRKQVDLAPGKKQTIRF